MGEDYLLPTVDVTLSTEALRGLRVIRALYPRYSDEEIIELLILDRASSSNTKQNTIRRDTAYFEFKSKNPSANFNTYQAAYNRGWIDFQTRHIPNPLILKAPLINVEE